MRKLPVLSGHEFDKKGEAIGIEILLPKQDLRVSEIVSKALKVEA